MKSTSIPTFCVVGQSNQGKTTLLATLTEDDRLSISNMPGTTTAATEYPVKVDGEPVMTFWDTPGFENTSAVHEWFQKYAESSKNPAADFIASHRDNIDFRMESEIFRPISEGAAVIYIVDSSQRIRNSDKQQIDVLRRSGNPRLAVIYSKDGKWRHEEQWSRLLIQDFNIRAPFNAHSATAAERFRLLDRVQAMIPEWAEQMENAIGALKQDHDRKLSEAAGHLISGRVKFLL